MAPNRKKAYSVVDSLTATLGLQTLSQTVKSNFLPLTDPREASQADASASAVSTQEQLDSYWDWPSDAPPANDDLFSAAHMEANLINDSNQNAASVETKEDGDSSTSYWDWPDSQAMKPFIIQRILAEEKARVLVSADTVVANELKYASSLGQKDAVQESADPDYWRWEATPERIWKPEDGIDALLAYEKARVLLSADHTIATLQNCASPAPAECMPGNDDYWSWPTEVC